MQWVKIVQLQAFLLNLITLLERNKHVTNNERSLASYGINMNEITNRFI